MKKQHGFVLVELLAIIFVLAVVVLLAVKAFSNHSTKTPVSSANKPQSTQSPTPTTNPAVSPASTNATPAPTPTKNSSAKTPTPTPVPTSPNNSPTISFISPANGATLGANPTVTVHSTAPLGFDQVSVSIECADGSCPGGDYAGNTPASSYYPNFTFTWDTEDVTLALANGQYKLVARIQDSTGKFTTSTIVVNLQR